MADLSARGEIKGVLGPLPVDVKDAGKSVANGEVNRQMQIHYTYVIKVFGLVDNDQCIWIYHCLGPILRSLHLGDCCTTSRNTNR